MTVTPWWYRLIRDWRVRMLIETGHWESVRPATLVVPPGHEPDRTRS